MADQLSFTPGQRWVSAAEPELGLGTVLHASGSAVHVIFPASGETRQYALGSAPLRRVQFRAGDSIRTHDDRVVSVLNVREEAGLFQYETSGGVVPESLLSDRISFSKPEERLFAGQIDSSELFEFRYSTLAREHLLRKSPVRGFLGARIDLIPHQLYIALEAASRLAPRILLADEVGLGKTIEAGLILHRLILTGRAQRVLILVPESLVHQWFVELWRRFNLWFAIFDEERCESIELHQPEANPFLEDQRALASIQWLSHNPRRLEQALNAGWDILTVDEAHHLEWAPSGPSPQYAAVERLSQKTTGLLLITATPEQLGLVSHFARLRLLDPDRYDDFDHFVAETKKYQQIARLADKLLANRKLTAKDNALLSDIFQNEGSFGQTLLKDLATGAPEARRNLLNALIDRHGPGRVMFRNTRATVKGFPARQANLIPLEPLLPPEEARRQSLAEFLSDTGQTSRLSTWDFKQDPRVEWLAELLRSPKREKILLICRFKEKVLALETALRERINIDIAVFHEELTLIQRDRNAAWFAEPEGAQILLCSEIGSEGRNFQFAHHLALFDLPLDPELVEQRIGRLDRIGQTSAIQIHLPYWRGGPQEALARWYHEGLNAFEQHFPGGREAREKFGDHIADIAEHFPASAPQLQELIAETIQFRRDLSAELEKGRDHLLELNSFRPERAAALAAEISRLDDSEDLEGYVFELSEQLGVPIEELGQRTYLFGGGDFLTDNLPAVPAEGLVLTADRKKALSREDVGFLTWEHPLILAAIDMIASSEKGNAAFATWTQPGPPEFILEAIYLLETVAPRELHADRFLPATPVRIVLNHRLDDVTIPTDGPQKAVLRNADMFRLLEHREAVRDALPRMLKIAGKIANQKSEALRSQSLEEMERTLIPELERLRALRAINPHVPQAEIDLAEKQIAALREHLSNARVRLDALRLILKSPGL